MSSNRRNGEHRHNNGGEKIGKSGICRRHRSSTKAAAGRRGMGVRAEAGNIIVPTVCTSPLPMEEKVGTVDIVPFLPYNPPGIVG